MKVLLSEKDGCALTGVVLLALLARMLFITSVDFPFFDEAVHITSAYSYMEQGFYGMHWYHQNLRNILFYFGMAVLGDNPLGWRLPWVLVGTSSVFILYLLTLKIFSSHRVAILAALLLAVDPLHISQSRINPDETMTVFTSLCSLYFALCYREDMKPYYLVLSGIFLGLGLSVKWYTFLTVIAVLLISLSTLLKRGHGMAEIFGHLSFIFCAVIVLPATIYLLTYYPWFGAGHSFDEFLTLQKDKYLYLQAMEASDFKDLASLNAPGVLTWFIIPALTGFKYVHSETVIIIPYVANPLAWLLVLPAIVYIIYRLSVERSFPLLITVGIFLIHYLPLLLVKRPLFLHSALTVLPAAFIAVSYFLVAILDNTRHSRALNLYMIANVVLLVILFPLLINYPIPQDIFNAYLRWLEPFLI